MTLVVRLDDITGDAPAAKAEGGLGGRRKQVVAAPQSLLSLLAGGLLLYY
jgi:hypothetical protein